MIIEGFVLSIIIGKIRGGKIGKLSKLEINKWYLFLLAFILEFSLLFGYQRGIPIFVNYYYYFHLASYTLLLGGFLFNYRNFWLDLAFLGTLLNAVVIFFNEGRMPVSIEALNLAELPQYAAELSANQVATHQVLSKDMIAWYLGDILPLIPPYPFNKVISIGDIIISLGIFVLIQRTMKKKDTLFS